MNDLHEYKGAEIKIMRDGDPGNPRVDWDNLGTIYYQSNRYILGDEEVCQDDMEAITRSGDYLWLWVSAYIHSGITVWTNYDDKTGCVPPSHRGWDSGVCGIIFVSKEKVRKEYGWQRITEARRKKILGYLDGEIKTFDDYLTGNVHGYEVTMNGEEIDTCWGFFGNPDDNGMIDEAKSMVDHHISAHRKFRWAQLKTLIRNAVPITNRIPILKPSDYVCV